MADITGTTSHRVRGNNATYSTARSTSTYQDATCQCGQTLSGGIYYIDRVVLKFDTSIIGASSTITQVNLTLTATTDSSTTDFDVDIVKYNWSASDPISDGNRETVYDGILAADADDNIWRNTSGISINTPYTSGNLNTAWINKTGYTYYGLLSNRDRDGSGTAPTGNESIVFAAVNNATEAYRPTLTVVYTAEGEVKVFRSRRGIPTARSRFKF